MSTSKDFDFLFGRWDVRHRRRAARGVGSDEWLEFDGTAETRPLLDGLCNIEEHRIPNQDFAGIALRTFDPSAALWSIYWVSERDGRLQPPVTGRFEDGIGRFEGEDLDDGRPVRVRFFWEPHGADFARWKQSFSYDSGSSWELNWRMDFRRLQ